MNYNFSFYTMARVLLALFRYRFLNPVITSVHTDKGKYKQTKLVISKTSSHSKLKSSESLFVSESLLAFLHNTSPCATKSVGDAAFLQVFLLCLWSFIPSHSGSAEVHVQKIPASSWLGLTHLICILVSKM